MADAVTRIVLQARFDPTGFKEAKQGVDDLAKYTDNVRKNQLFRSGRGEAAAGLNLFRQGSDVFTQGLSGTSPFTIAIQQGPQVIDILLSGAMSAGKFAAALGGIGVGVAGVMGAIHAYKQMDEAIQDAATSQEKLNKLIRERRSQDVIESGVAPGSEEKAMKRLLETYNELEMERNKILNQAPELAKMINEGPGSGFRGTTLGRMAKGTMFESIFPGDIVTAADIVSRPETKKRLEEIDMQMGLVAKGIGRISSGRASEIAGGRLFAEQIDPAAMKAMQDRAMQEAAKTLTLSDVARTRQSLEAVSREYDAMPPSPEKAQALNSMNKTTEALNALEKAIMERVSSEQERAQEVLDTFFDGTFRSQQEEKSRTAAMTAEAASARQRIGGMANAPILSSFQKQVDLLKNIADTSRQTAANTARSTPPASPVSFPDTDFGEWQSSRLRTFN